MRSNTNSRKIFDNFFLTVILFITIFSLHIYPFTTITLRYIGMGIVLTWWGWNLLKNGLKMSFRKKFHMNLLLMSIIVALYALAICLINGTVLSAKSVLTPLFNYIVFVVLFSPLLSRMFVSTKQFAECMTVATVIQSLIVYLSFLFPSVRTYLETIQTFSFDRYGYRIVGLGIAGAGGSVYLFCGLVCCAYLLLYDKVKFVRLACFVLIFGAISLVGRTGFYCACVLLCYILYCVLKNNQAIELLKTIAVVFVIVLISMMVLSKVEINSYLLDYTLGRLDELWTSSKTLVILHSNMPRFSSDFFFGTGETKGVLSDGQLVWHDSGYVQRFLALGILVGTFSYASLLIYYLNELRYVAKNKKAFFLVIIGLLFIIEYKEAFIYSLAYPAVVLILLRTENVSSYA